MAPYAARPSTLREASLEPQANGFPGGWPLQAGPFGILLAAALYLHAHWNYIPERFPIHWDFQGRVNGWGGRSFLGVYGSLVTVAGIIVGLVFLSYLILHHSKRIYTLNEAAEHERRFQRTMVACLTASNYFLALLFTRTSLFPWRHGPPNPARIMLAVVGFTLALMVALAWSRLSALKPESSVRLDATGAPIGDRTEDCYWKWGFYVNPSDPALMVEKRYGLGYTFNMGHPKAWLFLAVVLALALAGPLYRSSSGSL